ncbi:helix-turn-helix domain-containing protein [Abiotrophia defectiva]
MIRNRLSELLSERGLKITKVAKDTGISRNTLTATAQNDSKMIQYETIDTLCSYLRVTPSEFFQFVPYSLSFNVQVTDLHFSPASRQMFGPDMSIRFDFDLFVDFSDGRESNEFNFQGTVIDIDHTSNYVIKIKLYAENEDTDKAFALFRNGNIPVGFFSLINTELKNEVLSVLKNELLTYLNERINEVSEVAFIDSQYESFRDLELKYLDIEFEGDVSLLSRF